MNDPTSQLQEDDEFQLLASLGSTAALASAYEQSVLRDAKLSSAPQIVLPRPTIATNIAIDSTRNHSLSSLVPCGEDLPSFPNLSSLAPSTSTASRKIRDAFADVPHVLKVLSRTRDQLQSILSRSNGVHGGGSTVVSEDKQKQYREIDLLYMKEHILLSYLTDVAGLKEDDAVIPQRKFGNEMRRHHANTDAGDCYYRNAASYDIIEHEKKSITQSKRANIDAHAHSSSTNRLDRIKNGETVDVPEIRSVKRNTMMSLKSKMRVENGLTPLKTIDEERFDEEKSRKRRDDRKKRRLLRQRAALGITESSEEEYEAEIGRNITGVLKKNEDENGPESKTHDDQTKKGEVLWALQNETSMQDTLAVSKKRTHTNVFCPICQIIINVDTLGEGGELPDEFLAKHMAECQKGRRTLRKRKKSVVVDYGVGKVKELDSEKPNAAARELEVNGDKSYGKMPSRRSMDDLDEFDYEERVDVWIEQGLDRMKNMAERDASESPPGTVVYEGGLEIPAWINDRLFPYQRAGVRWMWELHCQGVGGVGEFFNISLISKSSSSNPHSI
jgi:hypothetical protein